MNILFVMLHPGYLRNYESTIRHLVEHGHRVHVGLNNQGKPAEYEQLVRLQSALTPSVFSYGICPAPQGSLAQFTQVLRGVTDLMRYFDARYNLAPKLQARVFSSEKKQLWVASMLSNVLPKPRDTAQVRKFIKRFARIESAIPSNPGIRKYILSHKPDVVLVTPLIDFASRQVEFVKSARELGIPTALCVASWDNLTNKGLIRINPDRVMVWNPAQRDEAIELHGVPADRIVVTGAQCYDKWFDMKPATTRQEFCTRLSFDSEKPILLYVCSSPFVGSDKEPRFVKSWIEQIRRDLDPELADVNILIRPHPQNAVHWAGVDFSEHGAVAIFPQLGANPVTNSSRADFYDSIYHSAAVIGINTSAMIEAAVINRPVLTVQTEDFADTQDGTLHFHHLKNFGLLRTSANLAEHVLHLKEVLSGEGRSLDINNRFLEAFVRPHGLSVSATPILGDAIEGLAGRVVQPHKRGIVDQVLYWSMIRPIAVAVALSFSRLRKKKQKNVAKIKKSAKKQSKAAVAVGPSSALANGIQRVKLTVAAKVPALSKNLKRFDPTPTDDRLLSELKRLTSRGKTLVVGPWLSEVGFEILYWVPFLQWVCERFRVDPEKVVIVTRGGAHVWYSAFAKRHFEIFDCMTPDEYRARNTERWASVGGQKQTTIESFDKEIVSRAVTALGLTDFELLHPSVMYRLFHRYWRGSEGVRVLRKYTRFQALTGKHDTQIVLPSDYVAVKFYFRPSFPDTRENRAFITQIIKNLALKRDVVILNLGFSIDDHAEFTAEKNQRIHLIDDMIRPENNLAIQTSIIANARLFVGTYGGLSYVAPFYGTPSLAFYSHREHFLETHLTAAREAFREFPANFLVLDIKDKGLLEDVFDPSVIETISSAGSVPLTLRSVQGVRASFGNTM